MSIIRNTLRNSNDELLNISTKMSDEMFEQTNLITQIKKYLTLYGDESNIDSQTQSIIAENGTLTAENAALRNENNQLLARVAELEEQLNGG